MADSDNKDELENGGPAAGGDAPAPKRKVEIDPDVLERLLARVEGLEGRTEDLTAAADVGRLARIQALRAQGKLVKNANLSVYRGKIVLGWKTVKDDVWVDKNGVIHEDQRIELYLDGGLDAAGKQLIEKSDEISISESTRLLTKEEGEVVSERKDEDGQLFYTIQMKTGRRYEVSVVFLN